MSGLSSEILTWAVILLDVIMVLFVLLFGMIFSAFSMLYMLNVRDENKPANRHHFSPTYPAT